MAIGPMVGGPEDVCALGGPGGYLLFLWLSFAFGFNHPPLFFVPFLSAVLTRWFVFIGLTSTFDVG